MDAPTSCLRWLGLLPLLLSLGCGSTPAGPLPESSAPAVEAGTRFNPETAGSIRGQVVWEGVPPQVPRFRVPPFMSLEPELARLSERVNPNAPAIDPDTGGVGNAVVFLRGIDPKVGRPWDHAPVEVELADLRFRVRQGEHVGQYGFVRQGESIRAVSRQKLLHSLHADGAAFFTLSLLDPDLHRSRRMAERGIVELSSASGYYWMRAYLFVDSHPYYCATNNAGQFTLPAVPPGRYELVCWLPNWHEERRARDPESARITRLEFKPPVEKTQSIAVLPGGKNEVEFKVALNDFQR